MDHDLVDLGVGMLFVLFQAGRRFNTPSTNRSSTTAGRYYMALTAYWAAAGATYLGLSEFPHLIRFLTADFVGAGQAPAVLAAAERLSSPLFAALLMTVLLPNLPLLSAVDRWVFRQLQSVAAIPYEVRRLSAELRGLPCSPPADVREEVAGRLESEGIAGPDVRFEAGSTPQQAWTSLTALFVLLERWEKDRRMAGYVEEYADALATLRARRQALVPKARGCFPLLAPGADDSDRARDAIRRFAGDFSEQVALLREALIDFVSRGILYAELTGTGRAERLRALGFSASTRQDSLTLNQMMALFGMVGALMLTGSVIRNSGAAVTHGVLLVRIVMIALIYISAVACAVLPRESWSFARRDQEGGRPWGFYFLAGAMAVGISQAIGFLFNVLLMKGLAGGAERSLYTYPWAVMSFATAAGVAFLVDDPRPAAAPRWAWRLGEGLALAAILFTAAILTSDWLAERLAVLGPLPGYFLPAPGMVQRNAAVIGLAIGLLVPTWYREA
ncbi:MAG TPA: hypothetical protein VMQ62_12770, partial [Dongiaceae bacterium]|nr:hypothetical protein [Dongiaceae bacterium]